MDIFTETHNIAFPLKLNLIPKRYLKICMDDKWTFTILNNQIKTINDKTKITFTLNINRYKQYCKLYNTHTHLCKAKNTYFQNHLKST